MVKTKKSQKQRFTSYKNQHCPYCGSDGAKLEELRTAKGYIKGYHGICINGKCRAENFFTNKKAQEWIKE